MLNLYSSEAVLDFTGYGFIGSTVDKNTEVLIVLSRISAEANAPLGDAIAFDTNFEAGFSKLYIYNAVTTTKTIGKVIDTVVCVILIKCRSKFLLTLFEEEF